MIDVISHVYPPGWCHFFCCLLRNDTLAPHGRLATKVSDGGKIILRSVTPWATGKAPWADGQFMHSGGSAPMPGRSPALSPAKDTPHSVRLPDLAGDNSTSDGKLRFPRGFVRRCLPCWLECADQGRARSAFDHDPDFASAPACGAGVCAVRGRAGLGGLALADRIGRDPSVLFRIADRKLSHRRSRPGLSDRARLGAADDGGGHRRSSSAKN